MEKGSLPSWDSRRSPDRGRLTSCLVLLVVALLAANFSDFRSHSTPPPRNAGSVIARCRSLKLVPGTAPDRQYSDRFVPGTKPTLLRNAKIWTGSHNGTHVVHGNVLLDKGLIQSVGEVDLASLPPDTVVVDVKDAWVTPGIVDMHTHLGLDPLPRMLRSRDSNSLNGPILPWLRSLDAFNTHDDAMPLTVAGGVTTALVLPGSSNAIGGQAFTFKFRKTSAKTPSSMLLEPPDTINSSHSTEGAAPRWRHMKHAFGENPRNDYRITRMDIMWAFRQAYKKAQEIKSAQDSYCEKALQGQWAELERSGFPEDLQWEGLVDVLRHRVKVHVHCYEAVDLDAMIRLSNEFKFKIAAVHHAMEAYLVPGLLHKAYGGAPTAAIYSQYGRYKREAYRTSEFAPRILTDHGIRVALKSDHPVVNSRYLLHEAQLAHYYGLKEGKALSAVTAYPAEVLGLGWRIGYIGEGYDADVVVWDSHPLALGATPSQVYIDGIPQLEEPHVIPKPQAFQKAPEVPNFDKEAKDAVTYDGLPPLDVDKAQVDLVAFRNVRAVWTRGPHGVSRSFGLDNDTDGGTVLVRAGAVVCMGTEDICLSTLDGTEPIETIDLKGGEISPSLMSFGSPLGLSNILEETSTNDGPVYDALDRKVPDIVGGEGATVRAVDGLEFATRDALLAYREGVTTAITAPAHDGFFAGLSTHFSTGASGRLDAQSVWRDVAGLHVTVGHFGRRPGISTQMATLRRLLLGGGKGDAAHWWNQAASGRIPLVIEAHSADVIATLIVLKKEIERHHYHRMRMTITGASEAHLLAKELADAHVGVILNPARPFPATWERRRILPGPPITAQSAAVKLLSFNVTVGVGVEEIYFARNTRLDIAWMALEAGGQISKDQALALGSTNMEMLLTGQVVLEDADLVATEGGGLLDLQSRVIAVLSPRRGLVDLMQGSR